MLYGYLYPHFFSYSWLDCRILWLLFSLEYESFIFGFFSTSFPVYFYLCLLLRTSQLAVIVQPYSLQIAIKQRSSSKQKQKYHRLLNLMRYLDMLVLFNTKDNAVSVDIAYENKYLKKNNSVIFVNFTQLTLSCLVITKDHAYLNKSAAKSCRFA